MGSDKDKSWEFFEENTTYNYNKPKRGKNVYWCWKKLIKLGLKEQSEEKIILKIAGRIIRDIKNLVKNLRKKERPVNQYELGIFTKIIFYNTIKHYIRVMTIEIKTYQSKIPW